MTVQSYGRLVGLALASATAAMIIAPTAAAAAPIPAIGGVEQVTTDETQEQATAAEEQVAQLPAATQDELASLLGPDWFEQVSTALDAVSMRVGGQLNDVASGDADVQELADTLLQPGVIEEVEGESGQSLNGQALIEGLLG